MLRSSYEYCRCSYVRRVLLAAAAAAVPLLGVRLSRAKASSVFQQEQADDARARKHRSSRAAGGKPHAARCTCCMRRTLR